MERLKGLKIGAEGTDRSLHAEGGSGRRSGGADAEDDGLDGLLDLVRGRGELEHTQRARGAGGVRGAEQDERRADKMMRKGSRPAIGKDGKTRRVHLESANSGETLNGSHGEELRRGRVGLDLLLDRDL